MEEIVNFFKSKDLSVFDFKKCYFEVEFHIGSILLETVLQAGLHYENVVRPRIESFRDEFLSFYTLSSFSRLVKMKSPQKIMKINNIRKTRTLLELIDLLIRYDIEHVYELRNMMYRTEFVNDLFAVYGIGNKSVDYLRILLDIDTLAIDRHLFNFVKLFNYDLDYNKTKELLMAVAVKLNISYKSFDYYIWKYMSSSS